MSLTTIDAALLRKMFLAGAQSIEAKKEYINELNVFPVPDGDTGTNMTLTIMSAAKEVSAIETLDMKSLAKAISSGSLRGARGNSGVILSQLFRGFTKEVRDYDKIDVIVMAGAFHKAVETAYKAVMKPKEGTILTVARGGAERAAELAAETDDLEYFGTEVIRRMEEVLARTPELLPVLKEAGVVDSGGQGLLEVMKGAFDAMLGKEVDFKPVEKPAQPAAASPAEGLVSTENIATADIKFGYCTEFIIMLEKEFSMDTEQEFKAFLESIGDSIVVVSDDDVVKVHVHTNDPGLAIQRALTYGSLTKMKIDNMREEHNEKVIMEAEKQAALQAQEAKPAQESEPVQESAPEPEGPRKPAGFVAVSIGSGINEIFKGLGVDCLIEGGQTMNPSTEDMLNAIGRVNADTVFILPNNSNIILAANQAKALTEDKQIIVIPSKTVPQGIAAMINYVYDKSAEENEKFMTEGMQTVRSGQVTYAVRDTSIDGKEIRQGDIMGLDDKTILAVGSDIADTTLALVREMTDSSSELISLYYGEEITGEQAEDLASRIMEEYPEVDVEVHEGGQPIYYYVLSVE
ncbi:MAG: DAK2 domain-containing protein [Lachnospiraceae bacterium]|nr:DAK2 domain-containing protein [Lachnospiraceae bacterium]